jgi:transcriptional regulator with XRE-family HTH domain
MPPEELEEEEEESDKGATSVGRRILQTADDAGISRSKLARVLKVNPSTVHLWGKGVVPASDKIVPAAEFLGVDPIFLLTGKSPAAGPPSDSPNPQDVERGDPKLADENARLWALVMSQQRTLENLSANNSKKTVESGRAVANTGAY